MELICDLCQSYDFSCEVLMPTQGPIHHVVILFKENHAFDNYFGTFPAPTAQLCRIRQIRQRTTPTILTKVG
jgi:phospholipase C